MPFYTLSNIRKWELSNAVHRCCLFTFILAHVNFIHLKITVYTGYRNCKVQPCLFRYEPLCIWRHFSADWYRRACWIRIKCSKLAPPKFHFLSLSEGCVTLRHFVWVTHGVNKLWTRGAGRETRDRYEGQCLLIDTRSGVLMFFSISIRSRTRYSAMHFWQCDFARHLTLYISAPSACMQTFFIVNLCNYTNIRLALPGTAAGCAQLGR